jgi:hypothetical protein
MHIPEQNNVFFQLPELDVHKNKNIFINPWIFIKNRFLVRLLTFRIPKKMMKKKKNNVLYIS